MRNIERGYNHDGRTLNLRSDAWEKQLVRDSLLKRTPEISWTKFANDNFAAAALTGANEEQDFSILGAKTYFFPDFNKVEYVINNMYDLISLLADHLNVQFNYYRSGIGACVTEMH